MFQKQHDGSLIKLWTVSKTTCKVSLRKNDNKFQFWYIVSSLLDLLKYYGRHIGCMFLHADFGNEINRKRVGKRFI